MVPMYYMLRYNQVDHNNHTFILQEKQSRVLMECLRLFKAFNVTNPQIVAFIFPRKEIDTCVMKLTMWFNSKLIK